MNLLVTALGCKGVFVENLLLESPNFLENQ